MHKSGVRALVGCFVVAAATIASVCSATAILSEKNHVISLDGKWRFKLEQKSTGTKEQLRTHAARPIITPAHPEPFQTLDYREDNSWHDINVPGNWEMEGYSPATYDQPDNAIGLYRLVFEVPADWKGRIVKINFDGVQNGAEVFLNGQPVNVEEPSWNRSNYHEAGFDPFQADLTPAVRFGQKNLLAIRVTKNTKSADLDSGDYFLLGGVYRPVTLFSVPTTHIQDFAVRTKLLPAGKAELSVLVDVAAPEQGEKVRMQLEGSDPMELAPDAHGHVELIREISNPKLWSAEHPNLYQLSLDLRDAQGRGTEHIAKRIGLREVSIKDGMLLVNGTRVKLTGICRHDLDAKLGSALNEKAWRKDLALMKAANVNAIRTSHYPYGSGFYDLCDEMGFYVADEIAACWCPTDTDELTSAFKQRARETVMRDRNHPSVIIWAVGNENKKGKNNRLAADEIRKLDPTLPRLVSWHDVEESGGELDDAHYTDPKDIGRANAEPRRKQTPKIYLENPNNWELRNGADYGCADRWAAVLDRTWNEVWKDDHIPGSFLWEWKDRAVADKCPEKLWDFTPSTGINLVKVKGICDGFSNPRAWYYHVKMVYAPIKVDLQPRVADGEVTIQAENHYSFTDLSQIKTTWHLRKDGRDLQSASTRLALAPLTSGSLRLELPKSALAKADSLRVDFDQPDGTNVVTYDLRLRPERDSKPNLASPQTAGLAFPHLNLKSVDFGKNASGWRSAYRHPGHLVSIAVQRASEPATTSVVLNEAALYSMPLADVKTMEADIVLGDDLTTKPSGHVRTIFTDGRFSYQVNWMRNKTDIQELGWAFEMPKSCDRFSWHRQAYWSYYPQSHVGRPEGTATPDSAVGDVTKITRPDAFDFNSTKYDCDWATLTGTDGSGVGVTFAPDARHHCRADSTADGKRILIVNKQCSPPRDISSGIVRDYYLMLERGSKAAGSFMVGTVGRDHTQAASAQRTGRSG